MVKYNKIVKISIGVLSNLRIHFRAQTVIVVKDKSLGKLCVPLCTTTEV